MTQTAVSELDPFELAARQFERQGAAVYYYDPARFALECFTWNHDEGLTSYQSEILAALVHKRKISARGPHGLGKTALMAIIVLWFALTRDASGVDWKVVTTAGAWRQLERYLWPEIHKWAGRLVPEKIGRPTLSTQHELLRLLLKLRSGEAFAAAASDPRKIEGAHADSLLYIFDESKAIIPATFDAAEGAFSGADPNGSGLPEAFALAVSTPGEPSGRFYEIHQQKPGYRDWWVRHVTLAECVDAGRVSRDWAEARKLQWGFASALYHNRVLGEFYSSDEDAVIPLSWAEAAMERWEDWDGAGRPARSGMRITGADIARGGAARTVLANRIGAVVDSLVTLGTSDTMRVVDHIMANRQTPNELAVVDVVGVGAGVVDRLRQLNVGVIGFSAGRATKRMDRSGELGFASLRALMWWTMRQALDPAFAPTLALPPDLGLLGELTAPHWWVSPGNKITVESKDDVVKRLGHSTDLADAVGHSLMAHADFDEPADRGGVRPIPWGGAPDDDGLDWGADVRGLDEDYGKDPAVWDNEQTMFEWGQPPEGLM